MHSLLDTCRLGEGSWRQSGIHHPLGLSWPVTTQDPCSTRTGLTQNLGHPPRTAGSPPTAWLHSDYSQSAKRLQTPTPRPLGPTSQASPPSPSPPAPSLPFPGPLGEQSTTVWSLAGRKGIPALPSPLPQFGTGFFFLPKPSWPGLFETRSMPRLGPHKYQGEAGQAV